MTTGFICALCKLQLHCAGRCAILTHVDFREPLPRFCGNEGRTMTILPRFSTPAKQNDFPDDPDKATLVAALWTRNVEGFTQQGIFAGSNFYFDPLTTDIPTSSRSVAIQWQAFPGRIKYYFPNLSQEDHWSLADTGRTTSGATFGQIPRNICQIEFPKDPKHPPAPQMAPFGLYGPRGWQDEYSEWAVTRNSEGQIIRIDFT